MGKGISFVIFMWIIVGIAGGVYQGSNAMATTTLTATINATDTTINVSSTEGFAEAGIINILDERIAYSDTDATSFKGTVVQPVVRGTNYTTAIAHTAGERVRSTESAMLNQSMGYKLAVLSDSAGTTAFVTIPFALISLLVTFLALPLAFLGTDLQIVTYVWAAVNIGIIGSLAISLAGGRRMS